MKIIDGSQGEGGGQVFRTSLTLSMCLGEPVTITNIRAGRKKPGLLRQHLTCLKAAQEICEAKVKGATLGSTLVEFIPGKVRAGKYHFAVGSAGSTTLVFQTVYLPLLLAGSDSELLLEGGTHNGMAPSFDFIRQSFLPELEKMGVMIEAELERFGFYPAGGGAWKAYIRSTDKIVSYQNERRGELLSLTAVATSAQIPGHVVDRELRRVTDHFSPICVDLNKRLVKSVGPGNILSLQAKYEEITECVEVIGERSVSAEVVADNAADKLKTYLSSNSVIGEYLADQLLLPMALGAGGSFTTIEPSLHLKTNAEIIQAFVGTKITISKLASNSWKVLVS
ncbi:RNA 3'-terminal phosphate cyclase [Marinibactrum halimedae]|uniref:RNA 3'-terminal phosphate cyclase n=1 Tax=Marinibactrum halimedae TaxID=1444977 RepID=A0AA37WNL8_9GAMM|nr:RNA 3'-terminal phosphate cyclase [Marinibactrum halimedae]MCD9457930.1 RNA 3'-terminal phosphate cyclase [Marinibactrum halimedae]GLS26241.1 RNA 3'-terminal phosphate cyclase [Marinibactrum halimedae]